MEICKQSVEDIFKGTLWRILSDVALSVEARGRQTLELFDVHLSIDNIRDRLIRNPARHWREWFAVSEFLWIIGGRSDLEMIGSYLPGIAAFSDDGISLNAAYGGRLKHTFGVDQLANVVEVLHKDLYSRQALLLLHDPRDVTKVTKDKACNVLLQFLYRQSGLHCIVTSRSMDVLLGLPYDLFHWTLLLEILANTLRVEPGTVRCNVASLHLYVDDLRWAENILEGYSANLVSAREPFPMPPCISTLDEVVHLAAIEPQLRMSPSREVVDQYVQDPWWRERFYVLVERLLERRRSKSV